MEHERPKNYFTAENWRLLQAPVVPPQWVVEKLQSTGVPVEWNNTQRYGNCPCCEWPMRYLTEFEGQKIVTRLLPGSVQPTTGWLR